MPSKRIAPEELRDLGYLQEVNRRFFHPLGMALAIIHDKDVDQSTGIPSTYHVLDSREDPDGWVFGDGKGELADDLAEKADMVDAEWERRRPAREEKLGWMIQPSGGANLRVRTVLSTTLKGVSAE